MAVCGRTGVLLHASNSVVTHAVCTPALPCLNLWRSWSWHWQIRSTMYNFSTDYSPLAMRSGNSPTSLRSDMAENNILLWWVLATAYISPEIRWPWGDKTQTIVPLVWESCQPCSHCSGVNLGMKFLSFTIWLDINWCWLYQHLVHTASMHAPNKSLSFHFGHHIALSGTFWAQLFPWLMFLWN